MNWRVVALLLYLGFVGPATAGPDHDPRIAEAAARIVAENIGPLRTRLLSADKARLLGRSAQSAGMGVAQNSPKAPSKPGPGEWRRGLALAVEAPLKASPEL